MASLGQELNTHLDYSFSLTEKCSFNQLVRNFLISTHEAICHIAPLHSPKEDEVTYMIKHFSLSNFLEFPSAC